MNTIDYKNLSGADPDFFPGGGGGGPNLRLKKGRASFEDIYTVTVPLI